MDISLSPLAPENLVSRDAFGSPVPRQPVHLHTQAKSGTYMEMYMCALLQQYMYRALSVYYTLHILILLFSSTHRSMYRSRRVACTFSFRIVFFYFVTTGWILASTFFTVQSINAKKTHRTPPRKSGGIPRVRTRFSLGMEVSRLRLDGTAERVLRDQFLRRERGQEKKRFFWSADHEQDGQPYPVDPHTSLCDDHT